MKRILSILFLVSMVFMYTDATAQVPNRQRKKPAKKVAPKPLPPPPPPVEVAKEPTLEETKTWILEKILKYKPLVYYTSNLAAKNNCSYTVTAASFDQNDQLILHLKSEPTSACYKDQLQTITINFTLIDVKRTNTVETTRRILLFPLTLEKPFTLIFAPESAMKKQNITQYNTIIAFDKSATYEPNLATRMGKALIKMNEFKKDTTKSAESY
jgi:hypothetical protein